MAGRMICSCRSLFDFGPSAGEYDRWYETPAGQAHDRIQKKDVRRLLPPALVGESLLDIGCGTGHWSSFFVGMGYRVTGIDIAPEMIEVAKTAVKGCSFVVADACDLPMEDASFDVVASMAALEFIPDPDAAVREMALFVKPAGSLLVGTLNRLAPLNQQRLSQGMQPYSSAHLFSPKELRSLLAPWGRVRMVASAPRERKCWPLMAKRILEPIRPRRREPEGPFIVAEVRL